jgi:hypothetical protein
MPAITSFTTALGYNGLIDIFALSDPQGIGATVWRARQKTAGGDWEAWVDEGKPGPGAFRLRNVLDADRHGHVLAQAEDAQLYFKERGSSDDFSPWEELGVPPFVPGPPLPGMAQVPNDVWGFISMCGAVHSDGRIDVVGTVNDIGNTRDVFYRSRPAGDIAWADWYELGDNYFIGDIVAAIADDDALDVATPAAFFVYQGDQTVQETGMSHRRLGADGTWSAWAELGPRPGGGFTDDITPAAAIGPGRNVRLFTVAAANSQVWEDQQNASHKFLGWEGPLRPSGVVTGLAAATGADGGIDLCVTRQDNTVAHSRHVTAGTGWSPWTDLSHPGPGAIADPALILDAKGCLNLLVSRPGHDGLLMLRQETMNGPFVPGPALPVLPH